MTLLSKLILHDFTLFLCRTDVDALLDDIVAKEPLITPSKMEQVRKLIISILKKGIIVVFLLSKEIKILFLKGPF